MILADHQDQTGKESETEEMHTGGHFAPDQ
jgi:hypothetical protein